MRKAWRASVLSIALCSAPPAAAQTDPAPEPAQSDDAIVVTGETEPPPRREVFDQALELSRVDPGRMYEEALARLTAPLCLDVTGVETDLADELAARIRANAEQLELRLARGRCTPNLVVAFVDDSRELIADLADRHPRMFELLGQAERDEILADDAPVRVWNVVETKWASGAPLAWRHGRQERPNVRGRVNRMLLPTRKDIDFALVVYDLDAVVGMTVVQLADYATMRGLSHTRPASGDQAMTTILALFDDADALSPDERGPAELTSFDIGYLRSVYFWKPEYSVPAVGRLLSVRRRAGDAMMEAGE
ncbi:MAG TPA: hypothetical protein VI168_08725 [Croceibacterium sp.]